MTPKRKGRRKTSSQRREVLKLIFSMTTTRKSQESKRSRDQPPMTKLKRFKSRRLRDRMLRSSRRS